MSDYISRLSSFHQSAGHLPETLHTSQLVSDGFSWSHHDKKLRCCKCQHLVNLLPDTVASHNCSPAVNGPVKNQGTLRNGLPQLTQSVDGPGVNPKLNYQSAASMMPRYKELTRGPNTASQTDSAPQGVTTSRDTYLSGRAPPAPSFDIPDACITSSDRAPSARIPSYDIPDSRIQPATPSQAPVIRCHDNIADDSAVERLSHQMLRSAIISPGRSPSYRNSSIEAAASTPFQSLSVITSDKMSSGQNGSVGIAAAPTPIPHVPMKENDLQADFLTAVSTEAPHVPLTHSDLEADFLKPTKISPVPAKLNEVKAPKIFSIQQYIPDMMFSQLLEMGFDEKQIKGAAKQRKAETGDAFPNVDSAMQVIFDFGDELYKLAEDADDEVEDDEGFDDDQQNGMDQDLDEPDDLESQGAVGGTTAPVLQASTGSADSGYEGAAGGDVDMDDVAAAMSEDLIAMEVESEKQQEVESETSIKEKIERLTEINQELKDGLICKICMDSEIDVVLLKCGHRICCSVCAAAVHKCPFCRQIIRGTVRILPLTNLVEDNGKQEPDPTTNQTSTKKTKNKLKLSAKKKKKRSPPAAAAASAPVVVETTPEAVERLGQHPPRNKFGRIKNPLRMLQERNI